MVKKLESLAEPIPNYIFSSKTYGKDKIFFHNLYEKINSYCYECDAPCFNGPCDYPPCDSGA